MFYSASSNCLKAIVKKLLRIFSPNIFHRNRIQLVSCAIVAGTLFFTAVSEVKALGVVAAGAAASSAGAAGAVSSSNTFGPYGRDFPLTKVNGTLDLSKRSICWAPTYDSKKLKNCREGDVVVVKDGTLLQILEFCKADEPIFTYKFDFACVYEDHEKKIYRAPQKKR
ncbi:hypothetical protein [Parasutterella excrementihominis]|uniref:hypothetical protein n=1 Tax=Parasutterella excrementihominis TaxID=487175 RepID=UPI00356B3EF5